MFSNHKTTNKYFALFTFFTSLIIYTLTMAPTASFWDAGEFIAVANGLQVNHPPGAPLYSLLGRLVSMFMPPEYVAVSINFLSALSSAFTVMFLYLIVVRLIREFKEHPDSMPLIDKIGMYGGALLGALTFAVTDTFWFNAVEAEVYAMSMFFTAIVVWLALKWSEHHDSEHNERWLVLIAYMFGLAIGVHLLNLLAIFFVALIVYFKKTEFSLVSFGLMGGLAVLSFFTIYPVTIQYVPDWADRIEDASYGLIGPLTYLLIIVGSLSYAIYYTHKNSYRIANIALISYAMILIGYSSYAVIMIRSIANPPIDENDPETFEDFVSYLKREQYGNTPILKGQYYDDATAQISEKEKLFPRRYSSESSHMQFYSRYTSDFDYFISHQINHMYLRYFNWNFIGREADIQDSGWRSGFEEERYPDNKASNAYFFIPFLLGLFGLFYHFNSDRKRAFAVLTLFIVTGLAIIVFLNQTPYQPRERDYAYVGSFFAFAIWIGLGVTGLIDLLKNYTKNNTTIGYAVIIACMLGSPILMGVENWDDHDRSERYVAPDYAKNLLESLAPNALVFTNGDNDTFPLWYAQEVEGIRTDVRIVCLSLLNTDWYIRQMKKQWSHESAPLPISYSDEEIEYITSRIDRWIPRNITIPVDKEMLKEAFSEDIAYKKAIGVQADTSIQILKPGTNFEIPIDELDDEMIWNVTGRLYGNDAQGNGVYYMQVQDLMILHLLQTNNWLRPIYFANTVSSQSMLGLQDYFRIEGKAYRIVPKKMSSAYTGYIDTKIHTKRLNKMSFRGWNDPDVYLDENIRRMLGNYRFSFLQLSERFMKQNQPDSAVYWLNRAEELIPFRSDEEGYNIQALFAVNYIELNKIQDASRIINNIKPIIIKDFKRNFDSFLRTEKEFEQLNTAFENARRQGKISSQRKLREKITSNYERRQDYGEQIMLVRQYLSIVTYVMFKSDNGEDAKEIYTLVNTSFEGTPFPKISTTLEESENEIRKYVLTN